MRASRLRVGGLCGVLVALGCGGAGASPMDAGVGDADGGALDAGAADAGPPAPVVETTLGPVRGARLRGARAFLGIPYAAPPVGPLRWRPPAPLTAWTEPRPATAHPSACPQELPGVGLESGDEDCLFVNVHTPDPAPVDAPVMVWIHGGAFVLGEGLQIDGGTAGDVLAREEGVVVVSMNYRLGQLGFLAHPALDAESTDHVSGNYGLLDQIAALEWVRDNVRAFGGDPASVTIFGESAGGVSVCDHLAAPRSAGLFHRAVIESGPCGRAPTTLAEADAQGARFATALGCDGAPDVLACMRAKPVADVRAALPSPPSLGLGRTDANGTWGPIVDGLVLPDAPLAAFEAGRVPPVDVLGGWNGDEGTLFVMLYEQTGAPPATAESFRSIVAGLVGDASADAVVARYSPRHAEPRHALAEALGDAALACPARWALRALAAHVPVRTYLFTYPDAAFQIPPPFDLGAFHSAEIQYVFGHSAQLGGMLRGDDVTLHDAMRGYWARFARTGDPNGAGAPAWPTYDATGDEHLVIDRAIATGVAADADDCAFWETLLSPAP